MTRRIPQPHPAMLALSRKLADTERRLRDLETASQAGFTSVEGRSLDFYDPVTDEKLGSIGLQPDGSFGFSRSGGAKPEAPTEPDVQPIPGGAIVAWDGRFEDTQSMLEIDRIAVHMDETAGFTATRDTEVAAIYSHTGGTAVIPIDDGTEWYVKLVAVTKGQVWSDPSTEVLVAAVDAGVAFYQDEFTLTVAGPQDLALSFEPISFSEHVYWNGLYQQEDVDWTRLGQTVSLLLDDAEIGDVIAVEYAYLENTDDVPFNSSGWSYKVIAASDTTDYSGIGVDDSSWPTGKGGFGDNMGGTSPHPNTGWTYGTFVNHSQRLWLRRHFAGTGTYQVAVRVDGPVTLYWNGTQIADFTAAYEEFPPVTVPADLVTGDNVLSANFSDSASSYEVDYLDLAVTIS